MKCYACYKKLEKNESEFGEYKCYFFYSTPNRQAFGHIRPGAVGAKGNITLCSKCRDNITKPIPIPDYIPEEQYIEKWFKMKLKKDE